MSLVGHVLIVEGMTTQDVDPYTALEMCDGDATYDEAEESETGRIVYSIYFEGAPQGGAASYCVHTYDRQEMVAVVSRLPWRPRDWRD
jgi:hypothetical protein